MNCPYCEQPLHIPTFCTRCQVFVFDAKCTFCKSTLLSSNFFFEEEINPPFFKCPRCPILVQYFFNENLSSLLSIRLNQFPFQYSVILNIRDNCSSVIDCDNDSIISFDFLLPITPQNFHQKLKTILTFL